MKKQTTIQEWFPDNNWFSKLIHEVDWKNTSLGEITKWPAVMRTALKIIFDSTSPMAIICGKEYFLFANEKFVNWFESQASNRKTLLASEFFGTYWDQLRPVVDKVINEHEPETVFPDQKHASNTAVTVKKQKIILTPWNLSGESNWGAMINLTEGKEDHKLTTAEYNEERYRIAIASAQIGTFDWDMKTGAFTYSALMARLFGYSDSENHTNIDFIKRIHKDDHELRLLAHKRALETGILGYQPRVVWPDESVHWLKVSGKVFFDEKGQPSYMFGTAIDITNQVMQTELLEKKVEERTISLLKKNQELKRSEERYHKMIDEVQDYAIIQLDRNGNILNWNRGAEKIKGYREPEVIGKNFNIFYLEEDRKKKLPLTLINTAVETGRAIHEGYRVRKDGTTFWGSTVITALHDERGKVIGFTKVTRDLTERKNAEERLQAYTNDLEFQNRELEQFAYIASHDLQEPLRKIQTFIDLLKKNLGNPELAMQYYEKIKSSSQRMSDLINAVLNYSRVSAVRSGYTPVDLNQVLEGVISDYELLIEEKNARIIHDKLPEIEAIPLQIRQLFSNLTGNALKFTEKDPAIRITSAVVVQGEQTAQDIILPEGEKYIELIFSDNGIGFDQTYTSQIFTIFQRLHNKQDYAGTGIGLALCKRIAENHNGFITAKSTPGKGSSFIVYLPPVRKAE